jgi:hypothetical protein
VAPSKAKRQLHTKHSHLCEEPVECFKRLIADQIRQAEQCIQTTAISDKAPEASYTAAEIMAER